MPRTKTPTPPTQYTIILHADQERFDHGLRLLMGISSDKENAYWKRRNADDRRAFQENFRREIQARNAAAEAAKDAPVAAIVDVGVKPDPLNTHRNLPAESRQDVRTATEGTTGVPLQEGSPQQKGGLAFSPDAMC